MTERANTPKLRFPEFNTDWTTNQAKNLFTNVSDKKHDGDLLVLSATQDKGMVPRQDLDLEIKYDKKNLSNYKRTLPNDFIISLRSFQGGFELNTIEGIVSPAYTVLRGEEELVQPKFFKQYFKSIRFIKKLDSMIYGIRDGKSISYKEFSTFSINYPSILEQQKIGNFFSKLDQQIELEEKKLELLEQQKRGYMQKIFSQELRFKDENGNDYPKWITQKIKELGNVYTGNTPSKKQSAYWNSNNYIWVTPTDINNKKNVKNSEYMLSNEGFKKARQLPKNTLLITCIASIGKNAILREEGSCNQQINALVPNNDKNVDFLYYAFEKVSKYMKRIAGKTATQIVNKSTFENISIEVPNIEEQLKIGRFLNSFDKLIEKQVSKIELLKQRKQGLLQKMFV
ncbi:restriction endonuclease subunit S [Staphylococcus hominis]|uniref:restriction endonuclease subunit S n=1 Tax=Staphylococcus hominis TaxID=1290 RepID=UPI002303FF07|nr:restriction endonuclease subunit S [Staphylococcus hominis]